MFVCSFIKRAKKALQKKRDAYHNRLLLHPWHDPEDIKDDRGLLGALLRYHCHLLDLELKGILPASRKRIRFLKKALATWKQKNYDLTDDIVWAKELLNKSHLTGKCLSNQRKGRHENQLSPREKYDNLLGLIKSRRSIRIYEKRDVEDDAVKKVVEAGLWAPSSCNRQAWKFLVAHKNPIGKKAVIKRAPLVIYIAVDQRVYFEEKFTAAMDAAVAIQSMLLAAHALGLGACFVYLSENENQETLTKSLGLAPYYYVYACMLLGYPMENPKPPPRRKASDVLKFLE